MYGSSKTVTSFSGFPKTPKQNLYAAISPALYDYLDRFIQVHNTMYKKL